MLFKAKRLRRPPPVGAALSSWRPAPRANSATRINKASRRCGQRHQPEGLSPTGALGPRPWPATRSRRFLTPPATDGQWHAAILWSSFI